MTTTTDLDADVRAYLDLTERIEELTAERENIKARLRQAGPGTHPTSFGVTVSVSTPRAFNLERAWEILTPEQQALCSSPDAKKVKAQLPGVLVESFMVEGAGEPRVTIK